MTAEQCHGGDGDAKHRLGLFDTLNTALSTEQKYGLTVRDLVSLLWL